MIRRPEVFAAVERCAASVADTSVTVKVTGEGVDETLENVLFGQIAKGYGIPYQKVTELDQVDAAIKTAAEHEGAYILEFICDPSEVILPMIPSGGGFGDMIVSRPKPE